MTSWFSPEEIVLLTYARTRVSHRLQKKVENFVAGGLDWKYLLALALDHNVGGLLYWNLKKASQRSFVPFEVWGNLTALYRSEMARYLIFADELERLLTCFNQAKIPVIVLKGMALAEKLYGNPGLRPMQDIDLLIHQQDRLKAGSILREKGYVVDHSHDEKIVWQYSYLHWEKRVAVDLHWHLTTVSNFNWTTDVDLANMWAATEKILVGGAEALIFNPTSQLIYLAIHLAVHHNFDTLIQLCDVNQAVIQYTGLLYWLRLIRKARAYRVKNIVYFALYFARALLNSPVPGWVLIALRSRRRKEFLHRIVSPEKYFHPDTRFRLVQTQWYESLQALADSREQACAIRAAGEKFQQLYGESAQVERARTLAARMAKQPGKRGESWLANLPDTD